MSRRGAALVEIVVGIALMGAATAMVLQIAVSRARGTAAFADYDRAMAASRLVGERLRNYVTAAAEAATAGAAPGGDWRLPGDPCAHALEEGCQHDATALLPEELAGRFTASYQVSAVPGGRGVLRAEIRIEWPDPP